MILIHRGKGAAVLMIGGILAALSMNVITNLLYDNNYYGEHVWPKLGTLWLAGLFYSAAGALLRKRPTKVDDQDWIEGESADHFFFIPVIYWGPIFFVIGAAYAAYSLYTN